MISTSSGSQWRTLAVTLLSLHLLTGFPGAAQAAKVPDLLELPARVDAHASRTLQLAVARAGDRLVTVGARGIVLLSDDDGRSWRQARWVPVSVALTDVHFASAREGWAVGHSGVVLHTADGGDTWALQLDGRQVGAIVLDDARSRAGGEETAGVRDAERLVAEGPDKPFLGVRFVDAQRGYVVGAYGLALTTRDGGRTWQSLTGRIPNPRGKHLYQVQAAGNDLLIAGEQGALFRSADAGETFETIATPYAGTFFGVIVLDGGTWLAYGLRGNAWRTEDGGASWRRVPLEQAVTLSAGRVLADGSVVLADESGRLLLSADRGSSFRQLPVKSVTGLTGIAQAADDALILSSARGPVRLEGAPSASSRNPTEDQR